MLESELQTAKNTIAQKKIGAKRLAHKVAKKRIQIFPKTHKPLEIKIMQKMYKS